MPALQPAPSIRSLADLFVEQLDHLHHMECMIIEHYPLFATAAQDADLAELLCDHSNISKIQRERLMMMFEACGHASGDPRTTGLNGLIQDTGSQLTNGSCPALNDVILASHIVRIQNYQIASYTVALQQAETLDRSDAADALAESLAEERHMEDAIKRRITGGLFHKGLNEVAAEPSKA